MVVVVNELARLAQYHFLQKFVFLLDKLLMNRYERTLRKKYAGRCKNVRHIFLIKETEFSIKVQKRIP